MEIILDGVADVFGCFRFGLALGPAAGQSGNPDSVSFFGVFERYGVFHRVHPINRLFLHGNPVPPRGYFSAIWFGKTRIARTAPTVGEFDFFV